MKKTTILILIAVYLGSIFVVGIFGMTNMPYEEIVPIETIIPTSATLSTGENIQVYQRDEANSYAVLIEHFSIPDGQEGMILILNYQLNPADATSKDLDMSIMHTSKDEPIENVAVIENGRIIIKQPAAITIRFQEQNRPNGAVMYFYIYIL